MYYNIQRKTLFILTLIFCRSIIFSQFTEIDSLTNILKTAADTGRVNTLNRISEALRKNLELDSALNYATAALSLAEKISFLKGKAKAYSTIGRIHSEKVNFKEAQQSYSVALAICEKLNDKTCIGQTFIDIGHIFYYQSINPEALKYYYKALKIGEDVNDQSLIARSLVAIGNTHFYLENFDECEAYHLRAKKIYEGISNLEGVAYSNKVIAMVYVILGDKYYNNGDKINAEKKFSEADQSFRASLQVYEGADNKRGMLETYDFLASLYVSRANNAKKENKDSLAEEYLREALKVSLKGTRLAEAAENKNYTSEYYNSLGIIYIAQRNFSIARKYIEKALALSKEIGFLANITASYTTLVKLDSVEGGYKLAYQHYKELVKYRDSLINEERTKESTQAKLQYEFDKKEDSLHQKQFITQTKLDTQQKQKKFYLGGSVLLGLLSLFVYLNFRNQKKINKLMDDAHAKEKAELELQSLRAQLNPHFMFNSLNAIQELILKEENEKSQSYLARFAKLLRMLLENADKPFIPLQREIDFLQLYLSLENLRIPDLQFSIDVDKAIDTEQTMIPNMILQPYIENAIWHGLSHKENDRHLRISISQSNGATQYKIEDNGVGRKKAAELKSLYRKEHKSKGMELLSKRFKLLAKEYGSEVETTITDVINNGQVNGTLVTIEVPINFSATNKG